MRNNETDRLIQCLIESSRCLGVYQQKGDEAATVHWENEVDKYTSELKLSIDQNKT